MPSDKKTIEQQIKVVDRQIDQLVSELYELTDEEIAIVKSKSSDFLHECLPNRIRG